MAVVLAGGKGERFWPKSRVDLPKPFLKLASPDVTLIQSTVQRLSRLVATDNIFIVTGQEYVNLICGQLPGFKQENIITEPMGRNTAACIGLASVYIEQKFPDSIMLVVPSDHLVLDEDNYCSVLRAAAELAAKGAYLVTIGIKPTYPETGYGYIKLGQHFATVSSQEAYYVTKFAEKPDFPRAVQYVESGKYLWNSGIFIWQTRTIRQEIQQHLGVLHVGLERIKQALGTEQVESVLREEYLLIKNISIDHGIMELADSTVVIEGNFGWDDVGTWLALERVYQPDRAGNIVLGQVVDLDSRDCIVDASAKLVALIGVENLIIVDTENVVMICAKEQVQKIKDLLHRLKEQQLHEFL